MQSVAQSWLVYRLTGSAALLGLVTFANLIPVFCFLHWAARRPISTRHRIMPYRRLNAAGICSGNLTLTGRIQGWHVLC
jgi:hypothetical protein